MRATTKTSAEQRLQEEVVSTELFRVLREAHGENFNSIISSKVIPVSGDVAYENLGVIDSKLREEMWQEIDIIVNSAATTKFDERYDVSFGINAMGAMHIQDFGTKCSKLEVLLHVSTAYVHGSRVGLAPETSFRMGETLPGAKIPYLDINLEKSIIEERLGLLQTQKLSEKEITRAMKDLGIERTLDSIFVGYGKGKLKFFVGDPESVTDLMPGDMVVNCMLAAMASSHSSSDKKDLIVYQVGSSRRNPVKYEEIKWLMHRYLTKNPLLDNKGNPIKVGLPITLNTMASFHNYISFHYSPFLEVLKLTNMICCNLFESLYTNAKRRINHALRLAELYKPYLFSQAIFDDSNTDNLRMRMRGSNIDMELLNFDPKCIMWDDYLLNTHFLGIAKYVLK
ncbi:hypothetical protein C2S53_007338 [Perilla frutescens var. hirtella]|uniref:Fatty acyl-CoA reductase n=1 Tax=Perilla frutescens var. hirtella TaxID=608512 RepID=A0AAD4PEW8_PERFH|nr:hypothetical protein C2S53_007338 [Perilla frutescens var. hirtella]